jgi:iron complex outermembrane receptor protein
MISLLNATFDEFNSQDPIAPELGVLDLSGNSLNRAPKRKYSLGAAYNWELAELGNVTARVDYSWTGKQYYRAYNLDRDAQPDYHFTNARIRWESIDARWRVDVWGANLEDKDVIANIAVAAASLGSVPEVNVMAPRTYGLTIGYEF